MIDRPLLRYHGGKFMLAPWIISNFPDHDSYRTYLEPFGGAASVLLCKERSYSEIYNDLDDEVVNLFNIVRDRGRELTDRLYLTPFAREEFRLSYKPSSDPMERARRMVVRAFMGFGSAAASGQKTGYRSHSRKSGTSPAHDWMNYPDALKDIVERLRGVSIEHKDALYLFKIHDDEDTLVFLDPPYTKSQRNKGQKTKAYKHEMEDIDHEQLCYQILDLKAKVCLCGYDNPIYNDLLKGWNKTSKETFADGAAPRTEILWMNYDKSPKNPGLMDILHTYEGINSNNKH